MTSKNPTSILASILSSALGADIKVLDLEIDPTRPIEDQLHAAADKLAAQHREECDGCRAKYEAEQIKAMQEQKMEAQVKYAEQHESRVLGAMNKELMEKAARDNVPVKGTTQAEPEYGVLGYMAFDGDEPLAGTFDADRSNVEKGMAEFLNDPMVKLIDSIAGGKFAKGYKIRTIYTRAGE